MQFEIPVSEVFVQWTEMPGSKIRPTSILHMAFELCTIKVGLDLSKILYNARAVLCVSVSFLLT